MNLSNILSHLPENNAESIATFIKGVQTIINHPIDVVEYQKQMLENGYVDEKDKYGLSYRKNNEYLYILNIHYPEDISYIYRKDAIKELRVSSDNRLLIVEIKHNGVDFYYKAPALRELENQVDQLLL